jgi:hypothetical protein
MPVKQFNYSDLTAEKAVELRGIADELHPLLKELCPKALKAGQRLRAAKEILKHGNFGSFCRDVMKTSERMCQHFITVADLADEIGPALVEQMPTSSAAALSSAPPEIVSQIVDEIENGGKCPSVRQIKKRIREARGKGKSKVCVEHDDDRVASVASILIAKLEKLELADLVDFLISVNRTSIVALCDKIRG